jgi:hypothetical protein
MLKKKKKTREVEYEYFTACWLEQVILQLLGQWRVGE